MVCLRSSKGWTRVAFLLPGGLLVWFLWSALSPVKIPSYAKVRESYSKSDAILKDRHGHVIHEMRVDPTGRNLDWTPLGAISPAFVSALLQSEDRRFYEHRGVDALALSSAVFRNVFFGERRGASTITMQIAPMLDRRLKPESMRRTWREKVRQIKVALAIERSWSKQEILETYLNLVSFRGELRGIFAASQGLFGKTPDGLDRLDSFILTALVRSPNAPPGKIQERVRRLNGSQKAGICEKDMEARVREVMTKPYILRPRMALAPHVASYLLSADKKEATSSLDGTLQAFATELLKEQLTLLKPQNVTDGAILVADNGTGEILAYVGNGGTHSSALWVDGVRAKRQAGSTLKPFLYTLAFDKRLLTAASLLEDSPVEVPTERGIYKPENYDNAFKGPVTARVALGSSLNVPAVRILMLAGTDGFVDKLKELGFSDLRDGEYYGFSLALGTLDVSLHELVNAYRALANGGIASDLTLHDLRVHNRRGRRVFSREASFIVSDILADREARSLTFGYENPLSLRFWAAAKTGTSKDMRDNWCIGFSSRYTVGVWIGNFSGASMWNVSGVSGAAPIWHEIMGYLHRDSAGSRQPSPPPSLVRISQAAEREAGKGEWFMRGTEPVRLEPSSSRRAKQKILYPPQNLVIALDPDIPPARQKVLFQATAPGGDMAWTLNDEVVGRSDLCPWSPLSGAYTLKLMDGDNRILDEVKFTVRE